MPEKVVIIGSGPAGWTAAIYAARANLSPLVYEGAISEDNRLRGTLPLGQLNLTTEVENYPGFPEGVIGPDLMMRMRTQAERYGTRIVTEDIGMTAVRVKNLKTGLSSTSQSPGMFVAIGHTPNTQFLQGQVELDKQGFIVLKAPPRMITSVEGVFAAGDVADPIYKQAVTA